LKSKVKKWNILITRANHGVYVVKQILRLDTFYSTLSQKVVVPNCIEPSVAHADAVCYFDSLVVKYTGTKHYDTLYYVREKGVVPEGVYVYGLKVRKRNGKEVEHVGMVKVLRWYRV